MFSTDAFWGLRWDCLATKGQAEESLNQCTRTECCLRSTLSTKPLFLMEAGCSVAELQLFCQQLWKDAPLASELMEKLLYQSSTAA